MTEVVISSFDRSKISLLSNANRANRNTGNSLSNGHSPESDPNFTFTDIVASQQDKASNRLNLQLSSLEKVGLRLATNRLQTDTALQFTSQVKGLARLAQATSDPDQRAFFAREASAYWKQATNVLTSTPDNSSSYFRKAQATSLTAAADTVTLDDTQNIVLGGDGNDTIRGRGGDDYIFGQGGGDRNLRGEDGNDTIFGGAGNDRVYGGNDDDVIFGQTGDDDIRGENGDDILIGGSGNDVFRGGNNNDVLIDGAGDDNLQGQNGDDLIFGATGTNRLIGGNGDDTIVATTGNDIIRGGGGDDIVYVNDSTGNTRTGGGADIIVLGSTNNYDARGQGGDDIIIDNANSRSIVRGNAGIDAYKFEGNFSDYNVTVAGAWRNVTNNTNGIVDRAHRTTEYLVFDDGYYDTNTNTFTAGDAPVSIPEIGDAPVAENYIPEENSVPLIETNPEVTGLDPAFGWEGPRFNWQRDDYLAADLAEIEHIDQTLSSYQGKIENEAFLVNTEINLITSQQDLTIEGSEELRRQDLDEESAKAHSLELLSALAATSTAITNNTNQRGLLLLFNA